MLFCLDRTPFPHPNQRRQLIREEAILAQRELLLSRFTLTQSFSTAA
jgi:hypothetical protein